MKHKGCLILIAVLIVAIIAILFYGIVGGKSGQPGALRHSPKSENSRVLIVYYSYSGKTEHVAETLQEITGGDLYDVQPAKLYSRSSNLTTARLIWERFTHRMPKLSGNLPNLDDYDTILIGTPVWNLNIANPIQSYLEQNDFQGKTVAPFWTYAGNAGKTADSFKKLAAGATCAEGLGLSNVSGYANTELEKRLSDWFNALVFKDSAVKVLQ